ncbi:MAG: mevalonate kinase [Methanobacteriota archaeon]|nr:MAG: mevalonate kinase [Euryarchaeota archaeon]
MAMWSAPGKIILFGEHAVVFGEPALALAIDLRVSSGLQVSDRYTVNGHTMRRKYHAYISAALDEAWEGPPLKMNTDSNIPSGSGLGSSAAVTVSSVAAMLAERNRFDHGDVATKSFNVERRVQGRASPIDTSTSTHGHGVLVSPEKGDRHIWTISSGPQDWHAHHCEVRGLEFVVGYTGIHASTGPLVDSVRSLVESDGEAKRMIRRIGEISMEGVEAVRNADKVRIGSLMDENHRLLCALGVGHPVLDEFVEACKGRCYGSKLTGAGGGGSMIALTDDADGVCRAVSSAGGTPIVVKVGCDGVRLDRDRRVHGRPRKR